MCARSGANCGSLFLDLRFRELVKTLLADHPVHLDRMFWHQPYYWGSTLIFPCVSAASLAYFMHNFSETEKLAYTGEDDDGIFFLLFVSDAKWLIGCSTDKMFHFTCFNVDPEDDPSVGLINGELAIPGTLLRGKVFDPVVYEVSPFGSWRFVASTLRNVGPCHSISHRPVLLGYRFDWGTIKEGWREIRLPPSRGWFLRYVDDNSK